MVPYGMVQICGAPWSSRGDMRAERRELSFVGAYMYVYSYGETKFREI